jgi:hypothetical protein
MRLGCFICVDILLVDRHPGMDQTEYASEDKADKN